MSIALGKDVQQCYEAIVGGDASTSWGVFGYEGQTELKVQSSGADDLSEFTDEFSDGRLQYAFLRVLEPNSKLPKFVLVGWCGDGAPRKGVFQQHFSSVASKLTGYHVQITARSEEDLSEANIMKKVEDASGAKYSVSNDSPAASVFGQSISPRKATTNSLVSQLKGQNAPSFNPRKPTQTEPRLPSTAKKPPSSRTFPSAAKKQDNWEVPKTNDRGRVEPDKAQASEANNPVNEPVKSAYQPIGRPDINALRAQGESENPSLSVRSTGSAYEPVSVPKTGSLADRMAAFTGGNKTDPVSTPSPRKASNPLASRFGGGKSAMPSTAPVESKAIGGIKNFGTENGKTPAQLWAERKARERGETVNEAVREPPVKATTYDNDDNEDREGVSTIRDRFAATSINEEPEIPKPVSLPPAPRMPVREATPEPEPELEEEADYEEAREAIHPPPPPMGTRPGGSAMPPPPSMPARVESPEPERIEPESEPEPAFSDRELTPEPAPVKSNFKSQLEQSLGGGGSPSTAPVFATNVDHAAATAPVVHVVHESSGPRATVIYEYEAAEDNEINLAEGEIVTEIEMIDEGWWSGRNPAGQTGLFPSNYVELIEDGGSAHESSAPAADHHDAHASSGTSATAVYEYEAAEEGEIGFAEGEVITHIDQIDEGWWKGKNAHGEEGLFPANYVELN